MKKIAQSAILASSSLLAFAGPALAQATFKFPRGGEGERFAIPTDLGKLLSNALLLLFFFAALLSFIFIVIGGIQWITAGGDMKAAQSARDRITAAVVGLIIVIAAFAITFIITSIFGLNVFSEGGITFPGARNIFPAAGP